MKRDLAFAILTTGIICCLSIFVYGQSETPSVDLEREIIVMFKAGVVTPPAGKVKGRPDEFNIPSQALRQILQDANVETLLRLMPDFRPEDRFAISRTGETVKRLSLRTGPMSMFFFFHLRRRGRGSRPRWKTGRKLSTLKSTAELKKPWFQMTHLSTGNGP